MKQGKISILMGIYNCADTLPESIDSILAQTYDNWELIMCDDGSTDNTYEVAKAYQDKYPDKIKIVRHDTNLYLSQSLNDCLAVADGQYIARMDGDDKSTPDRFEKQVKYLEEHPECQLVSTAMQEFDEYGLGGILRREEHPNKYSLKKGTCFNHASIMSYKSVFDVLGGYTVSERTRRGQDYDLWFRFFEKGFSGDNMQEPLYLVREDMNAVKRRTFMGRVQGFKTMIYGYKLLDYPKRWYWIPCLEIAKGFVPAKAQYLYRRIRKKK